jgi:hypothetical protein
MPSLIAPYVLIFSRLARGFGSVHAQRRVQRAMTGDVVMTDDRL